MRLLLARVGAAVAGVALASGPASPALANSQVSTPTGAPSTTAAAFATHDCQPGQGDGPLAGSDVWALMLSGDRATSGDFVSITATFDTATVTVSAATSAGSFPSGDPATAWLTTPAGWTLTAATAEITGTAESLTLTGTCPARQPQSPSPSAPPTSPTTAPSPVRSPYAGSPSAAPRASHTRTVHLAHGQSAASSPAPGTTDPGLAVLAGTPLTPGALLLATGSLLALGCAGLGMILARRRTRDLP